MAKVQVTDLQNVKPEELLINGRYTTEITEEKQIAKDGGSVTQMIKMVVREGAVQPNGDPAEDKVLFDFFQLNGYESHKDGGKYAKQKLASMLNAAGVPIDSDGSYESELLVGTKFDVITKIKNNNDDIPQVNIQRYVAISA